MRTKFTLPPRFMSHVAIDQATGCWNWTASRNHAGYGRVGVPGTRSVMLAHRYTYEYVYGPIPEGLVTDHLFRNPACVNPDHLEIVTRRINTFRGEHPSIQAHLRGTCQRGHPNAEHGHYKNGVRVCCRTCESENQRKRRARRSA
jgi:hypothetical protein